MREEKRREEKRREISPSGRNDGWEVEMRDGWGGTNIRRQLWFMINCPMLAFIGSSVSRQEDHIHQGIRNQQ